MIRLDALGGEPFDSPLILGRSKDERLAQDGPFDSPLILGRSKDERLAQDGPFDSPLILSRSKDERLAQDRLSNHESSRRLVLRQAQDERCAGASIARQTSRWRPSSSDVDSPLILSLSKDERLAQDRPIEP